MEPSFLQKMVSHENRPSCTSNMLPGSTVEKSNYTIRMLRYNLSRQYKLFRLTKIINFSSITWRLHFLWEMKLSCFKYKYGGLIYLQTESLIWYCAYVNLDIFQNMTVERVQYTVIVKISIWRLRSIVIF